MFGVYAGQLLENEFFLNFCYSSVFKKAKTKLHSQCFQVVALQPNIYAKKSSLGTVIKNIITFLKTYLTDLRLFLDGICFAIGSFV